jgi:hypothetical protein
VIVTGKGGTGKTTVSAALALAGVRAGLRVLVVEVGRDECLPRLFHDRPRPGEPVGYAGRELLPGLRAMRIDPFEALAEYLGLQIGVQSLVDAGVRNAGFRQLMEASPGWRELITLGKIWHLQQQERSPGQPLYDLMIVDAPATGHGVTFLDVPRVVRSAIRAGPLRRNSGLVEDMIRDQDHTLLLPVALGEELPARETATLVERARNEVGIAVDRVVLNAVAQNPVREAGADLCERLRALPEDLDLGGLPGPRTLADCTSHLLERHALNRRYAAEIVRDSDLPLVCLPYLPSGLEQSDDLATLADALVAAPSLDGGFA